MKYMLFFITLLTPFFVSADEHCQWDGKPVAPYEIVFHVDPVIHQEAVEMLMGDGISQEDARLIADSMDGAGYALQCVPIIGSIPHPAPTIQGEVIMISGYTMSVAYYYQDDFKKGIRSR